MNLEQVTKEVQNFISESYQLTVDYQKEEADLQEKVSKGLRGKTEVENTLRQKKQAIYETLATKGNQLKEKLETVREAELKKIEETSQPVTADTLAELILLSQLELTSQDLNEYINKYKHTPLALRKLQEIARDKKILADFPPNRKEYLNVVLGRMDNSINRFKSPDFNSYEVKIKMVTDGAINGHNQDVSVYRSL